MDTYITLSILLFSSCTITILLIKALIKHDKLNEQQYFKEMPRYKGKDR